MRRADIIFIILCFLIAFLAFVLVAAIVAGASPPLHLVQTNHSLRADDTA